MKNSKRLLALGLSAAMLLSCLTGCSSSSSDDTTSTDTSTTTSTSSTEAYGTSEYTASGLVFTGDVCEEIFGMPADTVIGTLNGEDLTLLDLAYWLTYDANVLAYYYYGTLDAIDWDSSYSDEYTYGEYIKQDALAVAVNYKLLETKALEAGLGLTDEQIAEVDETIQAYIESFGEALWDDAIDAGLIDESDFDDDAYTAWINAAGADDLENEVAIYVTTVAYLRYMSEVYMYYSNLEDYYFGEGGEYYPTDEDIAQYCEDEGYYAAQSILFMSLVDDDGEGYNYSEMDDEQKAKLEAKAQAALEDILSSDDPVATFEAYQEESDDTGSNSAGASYTFQDGDMVDEYYEAVASLEIGEISAELVVSDSYGYFIVMRVAVPADSVPVYYSNYGYSYSVSYLYTNSAFTTLISQWTDDSEIVTNEVFDSLDMTTFCTNLLALEDVLYPSSDE